MSQAPPARPMLRGIIGALATLLGFALEPGLGLAVGVVSGLWVLLGIGTLIGRAAERPSEHRVQVHGAVAHVVVSPDVEQPGATVRVPTVPRKRMIECPNCSMLIGTSDSSCVCGWTVPASLAERVADEKPPAGQPLEAEPVETPAPSKLRVCPACPQCRAPTEWTEEFKRFFCSRCDAYL